MEGCSGHTDAGRGEGDAGRESPASGQGPGDQDEPVQVPQPPEGADINEWLLHHSPADLTCSISHQLLRDPVRPRDGPAGHVFSRQAIMTWLRNNGTSPLTRSPLSERDLVSCPEIQRAADQWLQTAVENWLYVQPTVAPRRSPTVTAVRTCHVTLRMCCIVASSFSLFVLFIHRAFRPEVLLNRCKQLQSLCARSRRSLVRTAALLLREVPHGASRPK